MIAAINLHIPWDKQRDTHNARLNRKPRKNLRLTIVRPVVRWGDDWAPFVNLGQKLISTREELNIGQIEKDWAGDISGWPR